jgi:hypothetical protein
MTYSKPSGNEVDENSPLPDLAATIRRLNRAIGDYARSTLRASIDLGDALAWARARVKVRGWKSWRQEHCPDISARRDEVCRQLAASRSIIERALADNLDLSIRDALKLIATPKAHSPKPVALEKWHSLSADEKRQGLAADGVDGMLKYMPPEWRDELADRVGRVSHKTARDRKLSSILRGHIEKHSEGELAEYVRGQAIEPRHLTVHVAAIDAPAKRRAPLVQVHHAASAAVH